MSLRPDLCHQCIRITKQPFLGRKKAFIFPAFVHEQYWEGRKHTQHVHVPIFVEDKCGQTLVPIGF